MDADVRFQPIPVVHEFARKRSDKWARGAESYVCFGGKSFVR